MTISVVIHVILWEIIMTTKYLAKPRGNFGYPDKIFDNPKDAINYVRDCCIEVMPPLKGTVAERLEEYGHIDKIEILKG